MSLPLQTQLVEIRVELKPGILDAEAENVHKTLGLLGLTDVKAVTTAKIYTLRFDGVPPEQALVVAGRAVDQLLANPVVHRVTVTPRSP